MTTILNDLYQIRNQLVHHPIYKEINTLERLHIFMKHHAFAVWDFMSLLKNLQISLTCVQTPWMPNRHAAYARFINEIVLGEESDEDGKGEYTSHFELYINAMTEVGADTQPILQYLQRIGLGHDPIKALDDPKVPINAQEFVRNNLILATTGKPHEVTAAFFYGREDLIPDMFTVLMKEIEDNRLSAGDLRYYLARHIELDGDHHGPLAQQLFEFLCEDNPIKIEQATQVAKRSLELRILLWDGVLTEIHEKGI